MMFHALDDPYVPYQSVAKCARVTGVRLKSLKRGGHLEDRMGCSEVLGADQEVY
jgi:predicted alpha/beta hydrolase family esterase